MHVLFALAIIAFTCSFQSSAGQRYDGFSGNYENRGREGERRYRKCHQLVRDNRHEIQDCARIGSSLFFALKGNFSWDDACHQCQRFGGYLAPIKNFREYQLLVGFSATAYAYSIWLGGQRREYNWVWIEDNEPIWYNQWLSPFPSNDPMANCAFAAMITGVAYSEPLGQLNALGLAPTGVIWGNAHCNSRMVALCKISDRRRGRDVY